MLVGLSPFKNGVKSHISDEKEFYHCFSTAEHGNIFDFLMKTKSLGFGEAVKELAAEAGMPQHKFSTMDTEKEKRFNTYKNIYKELYSRLIKPLYTVRSGNKSNIRFKSKYN